MNRCIINGCLNEGKHHISIRCRRIDTTAIWAPNCHAFLCDEHAENGCTIDISITPTNTGNIETHVSGGGVLVRRTTPINHEANE